MTNSNCIDNNCSHGAQLGQYCRWHAADHPHAMIDLVDRLAKELGDSKSQCRRFRDAQRGRNVVPATVGEPSPRPGERWWKCLVGPVTVDVLPSGCDLPMRNAVSEAFYGITGSGPIVLFSGWNGTPDDSEREYVDKRIAETVAPAKKMTAPQNTGE